MKQGKMNISDTIKDGGKDRRKENIMDLTIVSLKLPIDEIEAAIKATRRSKDE